MAFCFALSIVLTCAFLQSMLKLPKKQTNPLNSTRKPKMTQQTIFTIKAAKGWKTWARYAAEKFATNRGIDLRLVRLARQLEASKGLS